MKNLFKFIALALVLALVGIALTAAWYLRWDELPPPELPGVVEGGSLEHEERERRWISYIPASAGESPPLLLVLHGSTSDGPGMRAGSFYSFDVLAEREGLVITYPDGVQNHWNDCRKNASYAANLLKVDDLGFLAALIDTMVERHGVDPRQVFVTGMSNGGHMAYRLALETPELIAGASALVANLPLETNSECVASGQPVPVQVINGSEDGINPYEGGVVNLFGDVSRGQVMSSIETARYWAGLGGYDEEPSARETIDGNPDDKTNLEILSWTGGHVPVQLVSVMGGGHTFPHRVYALPKILGTTSHEVDGAELIWGFFEEIGAP